MLLLLMVSIGVDPNPVIPEGAKLEKLYTRSRDVTGGLTEGPAVAPDGSIFFTDITQGKEPSEILRYDPKSGKTEVFLADARKANGLMFDPDGRLVACEGADYGGRAVVRYDLKTKKRTILTDNYQGKKYNAPNDLVIDAKGRIFFTDPRYGGPEPRELEHRAVYRLDPDGRVTQLTTATEKPNGIILSPDGKTLYVADHNNGSDGIVPGEKAIPGAMNILAFDLDEKGNVGKPRVLYDFGKGPGCDGMTVDTKGNLYLTSRDPKRPGVLVLNPEGKEIAFLPTGPLNQDPTKPVVGLPSNVVFGIGEDSKTLYVTVDTSLYRVKLKIDGYHSSGIGARSK
ncbi:MAG: SMP-30/gluconolactonase/LRE family protein [Gemmataceae bacterium]